MNQGASTRRNSGLRGTMQLVGLAAIAALAAGGCAAAGDAMGETALAVTAVGPDGATYRMPAGTVLRISSEFYSDELPMDGDEPVAHMTLPVGDYQAVLENPAGYSTSWPLTRITAGGESLVNGELLTAMPVSFSIQDSQTTELAVSLRVTRIGDVTFSNGDLAASVTVDTITGDATSAGVVGDYQPGGQTFDDAWTALADLLTFSDPNANLPFNLNLRFTSPWRQMSSTRLCVYVTADWASGEGDGGWMDGMSEVMNGTGALCVENGTHLNLYIERDGASATELSSVLGADSYAFSINVAGDLPASIYDGTTLSLSALDDQVYLQNGYLDVTIRSADGATILYQTSGGSNNVSIRVFP